MLILLRWWNWGPVLFCLGLLWWVLWQDEGNERVQWGCPNHCQGLGLALQLVSRLLVRAQEGSVSMELWPAFFCPMVSFLTMRTKRFWDGKILQSRHSWWDGIWLIRAGCFLRTGMEDVSLLSTEKTGFREAISTLVTGVALRWVIFICKEGLYCLLIKISFHCCGYGNTLHHWRSHICTLPDIMF